MIIKENVKNINLKWIYIITGTFLMAIAYKSIYGVYESAYLW